MAELRPYLRRPSDLAAIWSLGGRFTTLASSADTGSAFTIMEALAGRGTEPPLHIHHREHEAWYVLEGQLSFRVGDDELVATAGSFAFAPRGIPHAFTVDIEPSRVLIVASPSGFEGFASELGVPAVGDALPADLALPGPEVLGPVAERYGIEVVGPPLRDLR